MDFNEIPYSAVVLMQAVVYEKAPERIRIGQVVNSSVFWWENEQNFLFGGYFQLIFFGLMR